MHPFLKYVGTYSVLAEYDRETNDFVRDEFGNLHSEFEDYYIPLENNKGKILYYDKGILILNITNDDVLYRQLKAIQKKNPVKGIKDCDLSGNGEWLIHINEKDLSKYLGFIKPKTSFKSRDPFDTKNLPVQYTMPKKDLAKASEIFSKVNSKGNYNFANLSRKFIKNTCGVDSDNFKKSGLTFCGFIHKLGKWEEFLLFLQKNTK